ncbi:MAG: hypothetical protein ACXW1W_13160 [Methylococcaceae bacterium]
MNIHSAAPLMRHKFPAMLICLFIAGCLLTGCEKSNQSQSIIPKSVKKYDQATILEGLVSNNQGVIKIGVIKVTDTNDQVVASTTLQNNAHYRLEIPANTVLPIILTFYAEESKGDAEKLIAAVVDPTVSKYDINPLTTAIAKKAQAMGGYTHANMVRATEDSIHVPDANKTSTGFRGDPTTQYGGWH